MTIRAFTPGGTTTASATATSSSIAMDAFKDAVLVTNAGAALVFIQFGIGATTAVVATSCPLLPSSAAVFSKGASDTMAVITQTGTATVYATTGEGV